MEPDFFDGDLVLIDPAAAIAVGDVVVARHPHKNLDVIKNVHAIDDGYLTLQSPGGDDSRQFGRVALSTVRGVVTWNWKTSRP